jgi:hypothetical protein
VGYLVLRLVMMIVSLNRHRALIYWIKLAPYSINWNGGEVRRKYVFLEKVLIEKI